MPCPARTNLHHIHQSLLSHQGPHSCLPKGPETRVDLGGGGARIPHASFYSDMWFIGLQGIKVNQGRKTKSSACSPLTPTPRRPGTESPSGRSCWDLRETLSTLSGKIRKTSGFWFQPGLGQSPWDKEKLPFLLPVPHCLRSSYGCSTRVVLAA